MQLPFYQVYLADQLRQRAQRNPSYSLRAFAKFLRVNVSTLSKIMNRKEVPTLRTAERIVDSLEINERQRALFIESVARSRSEHKKPSPRPRRRCEAKKAEHDLSTDLLPSLILELCAQKRMDSNPRLFAQRSGYHTQDVLRSIDQLLEAGLLRRERGQLTTIQAATRSHTGRCGSTRRQRQIMHKAIESLDQPNGTGQHQSVTLTIDSRKVAQAQKRIDAFFSELSQELAPDENAGPLYALALSLFPLQKTPSAGGRGEPPAFRSLKPNVCC